MPMHDVVMCRFKLSFRLNLEEQNLQVYEERDALRVFLCLDELSFLWSLLNEIGDGSFLLTLFKHVCACRFTLSDRKNSEEQNSHL